MKLNKIQFALILEKILDRIGVPYCLCKICQFSVKVVIFFADQEVNPASESVNTSGSLPSFDNQVWGLALYKKSSVLNLETSAIHHRRGAFKTG